VDAARVAKGDAGRGELEESIDAGDGSLDNAEAVEIRQLALCVVSPWRSDPEFDVDIACGTERNEFERNAFGQQAVQLGIDRIGHAYFEHGKGLRFQRGYFDANAARVGRRKRK
jgi:hypothetical protein